MSSDAVGAVIETQGLGRFIPEPRSSAGLNFRNILSRVGAAVTGGASNLIGIDPAYRDLLMKQIEIQQQMQLVSMTSNIEKSKHETEMAAIRNIRVG